MIMPSSHRLNTSWSQQVLISTLLIAMFRILKLAVTLFNMKLLFSRLSVRFESIYVSSKRSSDEAQNMKQTQYGVYHVSKAHPINIALLTTYDQSTFTRNEV